MTAKHETALWHIWRGAWVLSRGGIAFTLAALIAIYFLTPLVAHAVGITEAIAGADVAAGAIEHAADGDIVKMLLIALIISISAQGLTRTLEIQLLKKLMVRPCLLESDQGKAVMESVLWSIHKELKKR